MLGNRNKRGFLSLSPSKSEDNVRPLGGSKLTDPAQQAGAAAEAADSDIDGVDIMMDRIFSWFLLSGHPNPAVKWISAPYMLFSFKILFTTGFYPEKLAALPTYYHFLVPVCWMLVLHLGMPLCISLKDGLRARIAQLARTKIRGNAELDENMCFKDPRLQDQLRMHGQAQKKWQEIGGFALVCVGAAKLVIENRGVKPGGVLDLISPMEVLLLSFPYLVVLMLHFLIPRWAYTKRVAEVFPFLQAASWILCFRPVTRSRIITILSGSAIPCIVSYFEFAMFTTLFWIQTETCMSWKVPAVRIGIQAALRVHSMFERWELQQGFAGFGPPATPIMLVVGLHVLPSIAAVILASLLSTAIHAFRVTRFLNAYSPSDSDR